MIHNSFYDNFHFTDKASHYKGIQESILKPTNRRLLDSNWENNIIWDTKASCKHGTMMITTSRLKKNIKTMPSSFIFIFLMRNLIKKLTLVYLCCFVNSHFFQNMKHMLKTPEVVVDPSTMHKVPIEKERVQESKGTTTPKKVHSYNAASYLIIRYRWRFLKEAFLNC